MIAFKETIFHINFKIVEKHLTTFCTTYKTTINFYILINRPQGKKLNGQNLWSYLKRKKKLKQFFFLKRPTTSNTTQHQHQINKKIKYENYSFFIKINIHILMTMIPTTCSVWVCGRENYAFFLYSWKI